MWGEWRKGFFLHFLDYNFCYVFETDFRFIYYIPKISGCSHNIWDCALCDII